MMQIKDLDIDNFKLSDNIFFKADSSYILKSDFPEASLYSLLKGLFGPPNGIKSKVINSEGDPDAPWKWEYVLKAECGATIIVNRSWLNIEIMFRNDEINPYSMEKFWAKSIQKHKAIVDLTLDSLEKYKLVINPYYRHKTIARSTFEKLINLKEMSFQFPKTIRQKKSESKNNQKRFQKYVENCNEIMLYSMTLVTESAFMVEALLNLIIAFYTKQVVRDDNDMYRKFLYMGWNEKIKHLHLYCNYFKPLEDQKSLSEFESLFKLRNKIAHSYPDRNDLCISKMWFDKNIPVFPKAEPFPKFQTGAVTLLPQKKESIEAYETAQHLIDFIIGLVSDENRDSVLFMMDTNPIGWNETNSRYSIPFGNAVYMVTFPPS